MFLFCFFFRIIQWKVCGRVLSPSAASQQSSFSTLSANKTGNLRTGTTSPPSLHPVGRHARMLKKTTTSASGGGNGNNHNYNKDSIISYGADGYPCGLWFLFHYLSGTLFFIIHMFSYLINREIRLDLKISFLCSCLCA